MKTAPSLAKDPASAVLRLALLVPDPAGLAARLARCPILVPYEPTLQHLHHVYFDTPGWDLRRQATSLRISRHGSRQRPQWLQSLHMPGSGRPERRQSGVWEASVGGPAPQREALQATPWDTMDRKGRLFAALAPRFVTRFDRTCWHVQDHASLMEVAFDVGTIEAGAQGQELCDLRLSLLDGEPAALFRLARQIAQTVAVLPLHQSKFERGHALVEHTESRPRRAGNLKFSPDCALADVARLVLQDAFVQFTFNLLALRLSDEVELVHQARVGWRRFKSALRLFGPPWPAQALPCVQALQALWEVLGELRNMDVARSETLPALAGLYAEGDARRVKQWQEMTEALEAGAHLQRKAVCWALQEPALGWALVELAHCLHGSVDATAPDAQPRQTTMPVRRWAKRRIVRLHDRLHQALEQAGPDDASQHRVRILAKRLRYGIEALYTLLPKRYADHWRQQAMALQDTMGATRDTRQALALVAKMDVDRGIAEFLRGVAAGREMTRAVGIADRSTAPG